MSWHIPWAETAQLSEFSTETSYVGTVRECVMRFAALPVDARVNALLITDVEVLLPCRRPTKILERDELETILAMSGSGRLSIDALERMIEVREAA